MTNCIVSGNKVNTVVARGIYVSQSVLQINGGYYQSILNNGGAVEINGNVKLEEIYTTASNGTVTISSGAVVDLTGNPISAPIVPGVGIVIPAGATVDIIGSDGPTGSCGHFSALAIRGATITNTGCIYGATVTVPASSGTARGPWDLSTTEGMVQVDVPGATAREEVIPGGLYGIEEQ